LEAVRQMNTACLRGLGEYGVILFRDYEVNKDPNSLILALEVFKAFNKYWLASIRSPDETKVLGQYFHTAIRIYPYALLCAKTAYEDLGNVSYLEDYLNLTQGQRARILLNDLSNDESQGSEKWKNIQVLQSEIRDLETKQQYNPNGLNSQENQELLSKQELLKELLIQWEVETADKSPNPTVTIAEIQAQLEPKQAFLTIDVVNETYVGHLITESFVKFYPLGQKDSIDQLIRHQHELLSADFRSQQVDSLNQELHQICRVLYTLLFEPIQDALSYTEELLLSPSGYFGSLSYTCLVTKDFRLETVVDWQRSPLLVHEMMVSIIPSWPVYQTQQQLERPSYTQASIGSWASKNLTATFRRLINAQNPKISYTGGQCNSSSFLENSAPLDHIFLAVHAKAVSDELAGTYLLFGSGDRLKYNEISQLDLQASLGVLAACETAQGQLVNYEGAYSMSRAFQQAGAQHVLSNLWSVPGRATEVLLSEFYNNLSQGVEPKKALQKAQKDIIKGHFGLQYVFPGCWGGGVLN
ncbi:MAG: CHAT domain-containing protein, partial [Bacteroidota bacterium]